MTRINDIHVNELRTYYSYSVYVFAPFLFTVYTVPFILLILDRKNYFAMVRQREVEKKAEP
jgi:uncharacterized membrane protein